MHNLLTFVVLYSITVVKTNYHFIAMENLKIVVTIWSVINSAVTVPINNHIPYGGKLWRVQTLANLAKNRPFANF